MEFRRHASKLMMNLSLDKPQDLRVLKAMREHRMRC